MSKFEIAQHSYGFLGFAVPDRTPAYALVQCEKCGRDVWCRMSRVDPEAWTREQFEAEYEVNEGTREIKRRDNA